MSQASAPTIVTSVTGAPLTKRSDHGARETARLNRAPCGRTSWSSFDSASSILPSLGQGARHQAFRNQKLRPRVSSADGSAPAQSGRPAA